jgi:hypothetical protein
MAVGAMSYVSDVFSLRPIAADMHVQAFVTSLSWLGFLFLVAKTDLAHSTEAITELPRTAQVC